MRETPRKLFRGENTQEYREFRDAWISGARADYIVIDVLERASMIGVHFKPGGVAAILPMPADELTGRVEAAEGIWGGAIKNLREALLEEKSLNARFALLEQFLARRLRIPNAGDGISQALQKLAELPEANRIAAVACELGMSQKHFISLFRARVGLTPKKFCRVRRFQKALRQIESKGTLEWADIACAGGYYDQSHFIRDFHAFSGLNPSLYLTQRGEHLGFVPVSTRADAVGR